MNDSEKQTIVFIPRNFIEKGTFMGGMFKIRNAIEGGILAVLIAVPVIQLPLSLTVRIIILCMTALPAAMISLIGIGGESISAFLMNALRFLKNRRVIYRILNCMIVGNSSKCSKNTQIFSCSQVRIKSGGLNQTTDTR